MNPLDYRVPDSAERRSGRRRILFWIVIAVLSVVVAIVAGVVITFVVTVRRLDVNLAKADSYIAAEKPILAKDPRFQNVELSHFTEAGGSVLVDGTVGTPSELYALQIYDVQVTAITQPGTAPTHSGT